MAQEAGDYASLADPQFDPYLFANDLLNITNSNIQQELDISTSIKKVKFDLNDLELQLKDLIVQDTEDTIISEFLKTNESDSTQYSEINDSLANINSNFNRLKNDLLKPYNQIEIYLNVLKKIHHTSYLVRDVTYFIFLVTKIQHLEDENDMSDDSTVLKLSTFHSNLSNHLNLNKNLKSLKLIRDYDSVQLKKLSDLENLLTKELSSLLNDLSIKTTKKTNLLTDADLQNHFKKYAISLSLINKDKLKETVVSFYTKILSSSLNNHLIKILTSSTQSLKISKELTDKFKILINVLNYFKTVEIKTSSNLPLNKDSDNLTNISLFTLFQSSFTNTKTNPEVQYWITLFSSFKKSLLSTVNKGGPVQKQLKSNKPEIVKNFNDNIVESFKDLNLKANSIEVTKYVDEIFAEVDNR